MTTNRINIQDFLGPFPRNVYSDYEELAFMNPKQAWVEHLFEAVQKIGGVFARDLKDRPSPQDFMDLVFYNAVHCLSAYKEVRGRVSKQCVQDVVEAICFTLDVVQTNDEIVRSSIDWNSPDAYAEWWQSCQ
jgi:hypothetical protein